MDNMTAKVSCFARAYHYNNNQVHIFEDNSAELLLGDEYEQIAQNMINGIPFIIFASGYDTYSLRNADNSLSVFEMDLPELLTDKME